MLPLASTRTGAKSGAIFAALGEICGLVVRSFEKIPASVIAVGFSTIGLLTPSFAVLGNDADTDPIEIQADHFEMLVAERRTTYTGNVVATQGQRAIETRELVVQFNDENEITAMRASGGPAKLTDQTGEHVLSVVGEAINYQFDTSTVRADGDSVLSSDGDTIAAQTITYDIETETARAVGTETQRVSLRLAPKETPKQ